MPPTFLVDLAKIDLDQVVFGQESIHDANPQRFEFDLLHGVNYVNAADKSVIGYTDVRDDQFWVRGHIPGRPLFPGVLMIETAAQLASFYCRNVLGWTGFVGFGGVDGVKFRQAVVPNCRMYVICKQIWERHRRVCCNCQGIVNGNLAFEAQITGTQM